MFSTPQAEFVEEASNLSVIQHPNFETENVENVQLVEETAAQSQPVPAEMTSAPVVPAEEVKTRKFSRIRTSWGGKMKYQYAPVVVGTKVVCFSGYCFR